MTGSITKIRVLRDRGTTILQALIDGCDAIEREQEWRSDLLVALRPWSPAIQGTFEPIGRITRDESDWALRHILLADPKTPEHRDSVKCHAVRMLRLHEFFGRLADAAALTPTTKSGPDPDPRYVELGRAALRLATADKLYKSTALDRVIDAAVHDDVLSEAESAAARDTIYRHHMKG